jgi:hypothetical protein
MSTQTPTPTRPHWTETLDTRRQNVSYALMGLGAVLLIAAAVLMWKYGWDSAALIVGFLLFGLTALGCGLWFQGGTAGGLSGRDSARLLALVLGGAFGLALTVGGIWQTFLWWGYVVGGTEAEQEAGPGRIWVLVAVVLGGLAVMFFSLLLARSEETDNASLRRLLYGYVAVLTGLLLLAILVGINFLGYFYLPTSSDWTAAGIYTLSSKSEMLLKNLKQPVKVYVMEQQRGDRFDVNMRDLVENARAVSDKVQAEYLIRDINVNEMARLKALYKPDDDLGLIVVYGTDENAPHTFIPVREVLVAPPFNPMAPQQQRREPSFKGEDRLMSAIAFLEEGKKKPVVYFTQGNGELDLFGLVPGAKPAQRGQALLDRLQQFGNYDVKGLVLAGEAPGVSDPRLVVSKAVPNDAAVVVVAGPTRPLSQEALDALKKYMSEPHKEKDPLDEKKERERKGKLMVLAGVVAGPDDKMAPLGLDRLLADYDVDVTNERVLLTARDAHPERVVVTPNQDLKGRNPLATLFEGFPIQMKDVRVVRPRSAGPRPGEAPRLQAVELLATIHPIFQGGTGVVAETDMRPAADVMADYFKSRERLADLRKKAVATLPVAVAVSEPGAVDPNDPHAFMGGGRSEGAPRVVVIGDTAFVSNEALGGRGVRDEGASSVNYELFASALAWLREKPGNMGIEPKDRGSYTMKPSTNLRAMLLFPLGLMSFAVVGLGLGVWVVRRR